MVFDGYYTGEFPDNYCSSWRFHSTLMPRYASLLLPRYTSRYANQLPGYCCDNYHGITL